jgi:hypothetical protein
MSKRVRQEKDCRENKARAVCIRETVFQAVAEERPIGAIAAVEAFELELVAHCAAVPARLTEEATAAAAHIDAIPRARDRFLADQRVIDFYSRKDAALAADLATLDLDARQIAAAHEAARVAEEAFEPELVAHCAVVPARLTEGAAADEAAEELELQKAIAMLQRAQLGQRMRAQSRCCNVHNRGVEGPPPRTRRFVESLPDPPPGGSVCVCVRALCVPVCVVCHV